MAIKCLATDFGRVVGTFEYRAEVITRLARRLKTYRDDSNFELQKLFGVDLSMSVDQEIYYEKLDTGCWALEDFWLRFLDHFRIKKKDCEFDFFKEEWCRHLSLIDPIVSLYRALQSNYALVGISNGDKASLEYFTNLLATKGQLRFHRLFLSGTNHLKKPELFDLVVRELKEDGIDPKECLYVDDVQLYVQEARRRLFRAFHFDATAHPSFEEAACHLKAELAKRGMVP